MVSRYRGVSSMSRRTIETTQYYRNKKHKRRELIKRYKRRRGCDRCGWCVTAWGLHFDHIKEDTKKLGIAQMMLYAMPTIKKEIAKCRLLCANCHAIRTEQQHKLTGAFGEKEKRKELVA